MIAGLKPYQNYRQSGIAFLGAIPSTWKLLRLKHALREYDRRSETGKETLLSVSQYTGVQPRRRNGIDADTRAESLVGYKLVEPSDLVINIMLAWNGSLGTAAAPGIVSPAYCVYRFRPRFNPRFFDALLKTPVYRALIKARSTGVVESRLRLYSEDLYRIEALVPPEDEQAAIVRFLDHANLRFEKAIRAKRRLIELLNEQKQVIILRAVTRGLDPNVPLKPSGIPWLGAIPEHWQVRRLRTVVHRFDQGVSPQAEALLADASSWGVLKAGCVNRGAFRETEHKRLPSNFKFDPGLAVKVGDVLISRASGSPSLVGSVGRVEQLGYRLILSDKTFRAVFRENVCTDFMVWAMNCRYYRAQVEQAISGAEGLANNLQLSSLKDFVVCIPPDLGEAIAIASRLKYSIQGLQASLSRISTEIDLIREYRTRLIADVVTGQLDVREAARNPPAEVEDLPPEQIEEAAFETETQEVA
jgi:type I restriction enzyme S subunit